MRDKNFGKRFGPKLPQMTGETYTLDPDVEQGLNNMVSQLGTPGSGSVLMNMMLKYAQMSLQIRNLERQFAHLEVQAVMKRQPAAPIEKVEDPADIDARTTEERLDALRKEANGVESGTAQE